MKEEGATVAEGGAGKRKRIQNIDTQSEPAVPVSRLLLLAPPSPRTPPTPQGSPRTQLGFLLSKSKELQTESKKVEELLQKVRRLQEKYSKKMEDIRLRMYIE